MAQVTISLPDEALASLTAAAAVRGVTIDLLIEEGLDAALSNGRGDALVIRERAAANVAARGAALAEDDLEELAIAAAHEVRETFAKGDSPAADHP